MSATASAADETTLSMPGRVAPLGRRQSLRVARMVLLTATLQPGLALTLA